MNLDSLFVLAVGGAHGEVATDWSGVTPGDVVWQVAVILFFVLLNGFFVAAEFAIVKVRAGQLDALIADGKRGAKLAKHIQENLDTYLSANQLGITLASIALGFLGESYVMRLIQPVFHLIDPEISTGVIRGTSFVIAYTLVTFLHVTIGEQAPKCVGIQKAAATSVLVARPLFLFYQLFKPFIWLVNTFSSWFLRLVFRIEPGAEEHHHSPEEIAMLVTRSEEKEEVTQTERDISIRALELNDLVVRDIMTPRSDAVCLDAEDDFKTNLKKAIESMHTRFPLIEGHLDKSLGLIHIKDVLRIMDDPNADLNQIKRELYPVPEMMEVDRLLKFFLNRQSHLALVVDEFGGAVGMVTLDNVIEELVGDIQDEFDEEECEFRRIDEDEFVVEGTLALYELADHSDLELESSDVSTVGGYVTHVLGHLPEEGEKAVVEGYEVTITKTDGKRVVELRFVRKNGDGLEAVEEVEEG